MPLMPNLHTKVPYRIVIYARDIKNITGCSERTARQIIRRIRIAYNKADGQYITISEFCEYKGLKEEEVSKFLIN